MSCVLGRQVVREPYELFKMRTPLIKFVGARLPRPNFAAVAAKPFTPSSASSSGSPSTPTTTGLKKKSGPLIEERDLPLRFRRQPLDIDEIRAINNGGSYGLAAEEAPKKK